MLRTQYDYVIGWLAQRLGYVPASDLDAVEERAWMAERALRHAVERQDDAEAELAKYQRDFDAYRNSLLKGRYGITEVTRDRSFGVETVTMGLRPPAHPL